MPHPGATFFGARDKSTGVPLWEVVIICSRYEAALLVALIGGDAPAALDQSIGSLAVGMVSKYEPALGDIFLAGGALFTG
jgi:hypothetical protein